mgnify:CR=1 FL=1|tara:strand:+ start:361 stop:1182 length:822 start_codon:yes stop_codon:yes gene_type:complete
MRQGSITYSSRPDSFITSLVKLFEYKSLIWVFAKRDLQVKYAQTTLGFGWSVFKPFLGLFVYVFFFGFVLGWQTGNTPYPIYVLSGLLGWNLFSYILTNGVSALQESSDLIKKIYFPKSLLPLSKTLAGIVELLISFILLIPLFIYYEVEISWKVIFMPIVLIYNIICGLTVAFFVASVSVKKRDLLQVLPFLISMAIWFTPVFLSEAIFPSEFHFLFKINPVANVIDLWRWIFFSELTFKWYWLVNFGITFLALIYSFYLYSRVESKFADSI